MKKLLKDRNKLNSVLNISVIVLVSVILVVILLVVLKNLISYDVLAGQASGTKEQVASFGSGIVGCVEGVDSIGSYAEDSGGRKYDNSCDSNYLVTGYYNYLVTDYHCKGGSVRVNSRHLCQNGCSNGRCNPVCGDGLVEGSEQCDDGNTVDDDGCSSTCTTLKKVGFLCSSNSECYSGNCLSGRCARGNIGQGQICQYPGYDDECDYGLFCFSNTTRTTRTCSPKVNEGELCTSSVGCISGECAQGACLSNTAYKTAYKLCGIVNNAYPGVLITDSYVTDVIAKASDMMFERNGKRFSLLKPIKRKYETSLGTDVYYNSAIYRSWFAECFRENIVNPPNGAFVYGGDPWLLQQGANGYTVVSDDLTSEGFCNSYPSSAYYGATRIPGGSIKKVNPMWDAVSISHEILHSFDYNTADVHDWSAVCDGLLGTRTMESRILGLSFSAISWESACPHTFLNFAGIERNTPCSTLLTSKLIGQRCGSDSECLSNYCGSAPGSFVPPQNDPSYPYKICMKRNLAVEELCFSDQQCGSGICLGLKCQASRPTGTNLPDFSLCTSNSQCSSGLCLGSYCFTRLGAGQRCSDQSLCLSNSCSNFQCDACTSSSHCPTGSHCRNRQCIPNCSASQQCPSNSFCYNGECSGGVGFRCASNNECLSGNCHSQGSFSECRCLVHSDCGPGKACHNSQCWDGNQPLGSSCFVNGQCSSGNCHGGIVCRCLVDSDCGPGKACHNNQCWDGNQPVGSPCFVNGQCSSMQCSNGRCV